jgi:hypothetical protein
MNFAKIVAILGTLAMGATLIYGFSAGTLSQDGAALVKMPWGIVSLIDVYLGFILFCGWIVYREKNFLIALLLVIMVMVLDNFIASAYALCALLRSQTIGKNSSLVPEHNIYGGCDE